MLRFLSALRQAGGFARLLGGCALWVVASAALGQGSPGAAAGPQLTLKIVGGLASVNQYTRSEEPFWRDELARLSKGKYAASIVPFDQAGVPGPDMLRLIRLGVVPFGTALISHYSDSVPQFAGADLAGMNLNMASLKKSVAAFRPYLTETLRNQHNTQLLAMYVYPAQVLFCKTAFTRLTDLKGRRVRVSTSSQAELLAALGAEPVTTSFAQIVTNVQSSNIDCAITGTMSGNTIGLHEVTHYIHALPITWGLAIFGANRQAWEALPPDLRGLLSQELPRLEARIWADSERETSEGLACNIGGDACRSGRKGQMRAVPTQADDERLVRELFLNTVLPQWLASCGEPCQTLWHSRFEPLFGPAQPARAPVKP
jgi:TRAP-type C4-dicarboxylate transport system substrate-binding protein